MLTGDFAATALAVSAASVTVSRSRVFAPLRAALDRRGPWWLAELASCPWCLSHWFSAAALLALRHTFGLPAPVAWLAVVGAAGLVTAATRAMLGAPAEKEG